MAPQLLTRRRARTTPPHVESTSLYQRHDAKAMSWCGRNLDDWQRSSEDARCDTTYRDTTPPVARLLLDAGPHRRDRVPCALPVSRSCPANHAPTCTDRATCTAALAHTVRHVPASSTHDIPTRGAASMFLRHRSACLLAVLAAVALCRTGMAQVFGQKLLADEPGHALHVRRSARPIRAGGGESHRPHDHARCVAQMSPVADPICPRK